MSTALSASLPSTSPSALRRIAAAIWYAAEAAGQHRAQRQLREFAALHGDRFPELARWVAASSSPEGV